VQAVDSPVWTPGALVLNHGSDLQSSRHLCAAIPAALMQALMHGEYCGALKDASSSMPANISSERPTWVCGIE
jgi:hypothetical protein